jgi:putative endonuclease
MFSLLNLNQLIGYVNILRNLERYNLYIGSTQNSDTRLNAHNTGKVRSTKSFRPWIRIWLEEFDSKTDALKREKYLKSGWGRQWINKNILIKFPHQNIT